jgi:hypothetical protein
MRGIYEDAAPIPGVVITETASQFLDAVRELVHTAIEAADGEVRLAPIKRPHNRLAVRLSAPRKRLRTHAPSTGSGAGNPQVGNTLRAYQTAKFRSACARPHSLVGPLSDGKATVSFRPSSPFTSDSSAGLLPPSVTGLITPDTSPVSINGFSDVASFVADTLYPNAFCNRRGSASKTGCHDGA